MSSHPLKPLLGLTLVLSTQTVWAACPPPVEIAVHTNALFIPRDAPVGSLITRAVVNYDGTRSHVCPDRLVVNEMLAGPRIPPMTVAPVPGLATGRIGEHLYETGVAGIGIGAIHSDGTFCITPGTTFPADQRVFPFTARSCSNRYETRVYYYLFKTGPIEPGVHTLNINALRVLFDGAVQTSLTLNQSVTVAGCSMPDFADNQIEVAMLPTNVRDFSGPGTSGPAKPFQISMYSCIRGTYSQYYPWNYFIGNYANVRLEPSRGSTIIDAQMGVVGLRPESTAKGIGVQVLRDDMSPMQLGSDVQLNHVEDGITQLPFQARYIQVGDAAPEGGSADATVNFTVTFR